MVDIDLAIKANYSQQLMAKLTDRQHRALRLLTLEDLSGRIAPKLDFKSLKNYSEMANVLEIWCNEQISRYIIT